MERTNRGFGFVSRTDERMVIDIPLPGFKKENIVVSAVNAPSLKNVGRYIKVRATWEREDGEDGKKKIHVGYDHVIPDSVKEDVEVREDFDIAKAKVSYFNGLLRIEIPKVAEAMGTALTLD